MLNEGTLYRTRLMRHIANALLLDIKVVGTWLIARERVRGLRQAMHIDNLIIIVGEAAFSETDRTRIIPWQGRCAG